MPDRARSRYQLPVAHRAVPTPPRHPPFPTTSTRQDLTKQETTEVQSNLEMPVIKCNNEASHMFWSFPSPWSDRVMSQLHELSPGLCFPERGVLPAVPQSHFSSRASWVRGEKGTVKNWALLLGISHNTRSFSWQPPKICVSLRQEFTVSLSWGTGQEEDPTALKDFTGSTFTRHQEIHCHYQTFLSEIVFIIQNAGVWGFSHFWESPPTPL